MKSHLVSATLAVLTIFTSMSASSAMADSIIKVQKPIDINPNIQLRPTTSISGVITNGGSNNGGQPNFTCDQIQVYVAENITPPPSGSGITFLKFYSSNERDPRPLTSIFGISDKPCFVLSQSLSKSKA